MRSRKKRTVAIRVIHSEQDEITISCPRCEKILGSSKFSIILIDGTRQYIFLSDETVECCGQDIDIPVGYSDYESAVEMQEEVVATIKEYGHTRSFQLQELKDTVITYVNN